VFQDLVNRGEKRVSVFVTDDFRGIGDVIAKLFPFTDHRLCLLHVQRNLRRKLSSGAYREAGRLLRKIRDAKDKEEGEGLFSTMCRVVEGENATWAEKLQVKADKYLAFPGLPRRGTQAHLHHQLGGIGERGDRADEAGAGRVFPLGAGPGGEPLHPGGELTRPLVEEPVPTVRAKTYELLQFFAMRYELAGDFEPIHNF